VAAPGPSALDADFAAIDKDPRKPPSPAVDQRAFGRCQAASDLEVKAQNLAPPDQMKMWAAELPGAIDACKCHVDMALVKTLMWHWMYHAGPTYLVGKPVRLGDGGTTVSLPPDAPWSQAYGKVLDAARAGPVVFSTT
jgi:hypothetical protein